MMTNGDFAMYAMRIASRAASWAGDCMTLPDHRDRPMRQEAADRFLKDQRQLLDWIEQETRDAAPATS
jgi:hypothetical protein